MPVCPNTARETSRRTGSSFADRKKLTGVTDLLVRARRPSSTRASRREWGSIWYNDGGEWFRQERNRRLAATPEHQSSASAKKKDPRLREGPSLECLSRA